eukprot:TRINITY_DN17102_c0_g1_i1.p1 TRINITY_DN17102_c0_g1~~TRINITY_DN17102_c0_g1_i1.p1  ORF type:complete len:439 (-),score=148.36 TRINITY_DN17102_c0_g1_i1:451-1638(-)
MGKKKKGLVGDAAKSLPDLETVVASWLASRSSVGAATAPVASAVLEEGKTSNGVVEDAAQPTKAAQGRKRKGGTEKPEDSVVAEVKADEAAAKESAKVTKAAAKGSKKRKVAEEAKVEIVEAKSVSVAQNEVKLAKGKVEEDKVEKPAGKTRSKKGKETQQKEEGAEATTSVNEQVANGVPAVAASVANGEKAGSKKNKSKVEKAVAEAEITNAEDEKAEGAADKKGKKKEKKRSIQDIVEKVKEKGTKEEDEGEEADDEDDEEKGKDKERTLADINKYGKPSSRAEEEPAKGVGGSAKKGDEQQAKGTGTGAKAFQRVKVEEVQFKDERLRDNSYWAKGGANAGWGAKAQEILGQVRGKDFRHEKTKKKRGSYKGGAIDFASHSIKFENSDDDE